MALLSQSPWLGFSSNKQEKLWQGGGGPIGLLCQIWGIWGSPGQWDVLKGARRSLQYDHATQAAGLP